MSDITENARRSNHSIFLPQNFGSPFNDTAEHITGLGLARIDFERCAIAGEVIYSVEGDSIPTSQQDEESRIAMLAHALKKLGNPYELLKRRRSKQRGGVARGRGGGLGGQYRRAEPRDGRRRDRSSGLCAD